MKTTTLNRLIPALAFASIAFLSLVQLAAPASAKRGPDPQPITYTCRIGSSCVDQTTGTMNSVGRGSCTQAILNSLPECNN